MCRCVIGVDVRFHRRNGFCHCLAACVLLHSRIAYHDILRVDAAFGYAALAVALKAEADGLADLGGCGAGGQAAVAVGIGGGSAALGRGMAAQA